MQNNPKSVIVHSIGVPDIVESRFNVGHVRAWHTAKPPIGRGWKDIGYHKYIDRVGNIQMGRELNIIGAHTKGHNKDSIGIAYEGSYFPTVEQFRAMMNLYRSFRDIYQIQFTDWFGHREFNDKTECPGFEMESFRNILSMLA